MKIKKLINIFEEFDASDYEVQMPYIIAEVGVNHQCDMALAKRLICEAKEGGADAVKFQSYKADTIAMKDSPSYWDLSKEPLTNQHALFKKYDAFGQEEYMSLKEYCDQVDIEFMSTPFDIESADFLNDMMSVYKISSSDITNKPFIEYICKFKKPIILSVGASNLDEIEEAVFWIDKLGNPLAIMHCVLNYPTNDANANLGRICTLKKKFPENIIGYSDHTLPADMKNLELAALLGARLVEKHFTYDKTLQGNDHYHAMDKEDLKLFKRNFKDVLNVIGSYDIAALESESLARKNARRSLVAAKDIPKGKVVDGSDLTWKRPAIGISPKNIDNVVGKISNKLIKEDEAIKKEFLK